ncbi:melanotransferrin isoform X2 [Leptopilina heterotoma]|uniref:melanotransferrin isoform X2 n=1 Tax=Leptopilina heterotoma TaxID=63436 RepID=UPI001CA98417|nr:melanotransferrin isoform X2 [Leptopilina heterotoma]
MDFFIKMKCNCYFFSASLLWIFIIYLQNVQAGQNDTIVTWCTVSKEEFEKCKQFSNVTMKDRAYFGAHFIQLNCTHAFNKEECMFLLDQEKAQLTTLDPGEVFTAGRYHSLIPIMKEIYENKLNYQYAVAVVKKNTLTDVSSLYNLRGKKACFPGVGILGGWVIPLNQLLKNGGMEIHDCNNHVKSAIQYFGPSCAVNSLIDKYNPLGDNSHQLCNLCIGKLPGGKCTNADPYSGYEGAFRCLSEAGDIAFLVHTTVQEMTSKTYENSLHTKNDYELLCLDGSRRPVDEYRICNWGEIPSRAIVTSSATNHFTRKLYQRFLEKAARRYSTERHNSTYDYNSRPDYSSNNNSGYDRRKYYGNNNNNNPSGYSNYDNPNEFGNMDYREGFDGYQNNDDRRYSTEAPFIKNPDNFNLFESPSNYSKHNLLFSDVARDFVSLPEKSQIYSEYLGKNLDYVLALRNCPVNRMKICVTSDPELAKCFKMKIALDAQLLKPQVVCHKGYSHINCMREIEKGFADVAVLDASDVYTAGLRFNLIPFISEVYNLGSPEYYVVAVGKEDDPDTDLTYLKNKYTCHTGINTAAGWVYPLSYLLTNRWMRGYGCDSVRAAAEYFTKSCVPGALSPEYNIGVPYDNMCDLCHGTDNKYCRRDHSEDYFGYTGAFRCLVEGGGDVAFVKHTTVAENTDGKRKEWWARNTFTRDFQLLCPDGTRRSTHKYKECNLGKVAANAIVTRGGEAYNETQVNAFINLFIYAQQFYGRKDQDDFSFSMFYSVPPYSDLIFQDATQQLVVIPREKREYSSYLGPDFMRARRVVDCAAGASSVTYSLLGTFTMITLALLFSR